MLLEEADVDADTRLQSTDGISAIKGGTRDIRSRRLTRDARIEALNVNNNPANVYVTRDEEQKLVETFAEFYTLFSDYSETIQSKYLEYFTREAGSHVHSEASALKLALYGPPEHGDFFACARACDKFHDVLIEIGARHGVFNGEQIDIIKQLRSSIDVYDGSVSYDNLKLQGLLEKYNRIVLLHNTTMPVFDEDAVNRSKEVDSYTRAVAFPEWMRRYSTRFNSSMPDSRIEPDSKYEQVQEEIASRLFATAAATTAAASGKYEPLSLAEVDPESLLDEWRKKAPSSGSPARQRQDAPIYGDKRLSPFQVDPRKRVKSRTRHSKVGANESSKDTKDSAIFASDAIKSALRSTAAATNGANSNLPNTVPEGMSAEQYVYEVLERKPFTSMALVESYVVCPDALESTTGNTNETEKIVAEYFEHERVKFENEMSSTRLSGFANLLSALVRMSSIPASAVAASLPSWMPSSSLYAFAGLPSQLIGKAGDMLGFSSSTVNWLTGTMIDGLVSTLFELREDYSFSYKLSIDSHAFLVREQSNLDMRKAAEISLKIAERLERLAPATGDRQDVAKRRAEAKAEVEAQRASASVTSPGSEQSQENYLRTMGHALPDDMLAALVADSFSSGLRNMLVNPNDASLSDIVAYCNAGLNGYAPTVLYLRKIAEYDKTVASNTVTSNALAAAFADPVESLKNAAQRGVKPMREFVSAYIAFLEDRIKIDGDKADMAKEKYLKIREEYNKKGSRVDEIGNLIKERQKQLQQQQDALEDANRKYRETIEITKARIAALEASMSETSDTLKMALLAQMSIEKYDIEAFELRKKLDDFRNQVTVLTETITNEQRRNRELQESLSNTRDSRPEDILSSRGRVQSFSETITGARQVDALKTGLALSVVVPTLVKFGTDTMFPSSGLKTLVQTVTTVAGLSYIATGSAIDYLKNWWNNGDSLKETSQLDKLTDAIEGRADEDRLETLTTLSETDTSLGSVEKILGVKLNSEVPEIIEYLNDAKKDSENRLAGLQKKLDALKLDAQQAQMNLKRIIEIERPNAIKIAENVEYTGEMITEDTQIGRDAIANSERELEKIKSDTEPIIEKIKTEIDDLRNFETIEVDEQNRIAVEKQALETEFERAQRKLQNLGPVLQQLYDINAKAVDAKNELILPELVQNVVVNYKEKFESVTLTSKELDTYLKTYLQVASNWADISSMATKMSLSQIPQDLNLERFQTLENILKKASSVSPSAYSQTLSYAETEILRGFASDASKLQGILSTLNMDTLMQTPKTRAVFLDIKDGAPSEEWYLPPNITLQYIVRPDATNKHDLQSELISEFGQMDDDKMAKFLRTMDHIRNAFYQEKFSMIVANWTYRQQIIKERSDVSEQTKANALPSKFFTDVKQHMLESINDNQLLSDDATEEGTGNLLPIETAQALNATKENAALLRQSLQRLGASYQSMFYLHKTLENRPELMPSFLKTAIETASKNSGGITFSDCLQMAAELQCSNAYLRYRYEFLIQRPDESQVQYMDRIAAAESSASESSAEKQRKSSATEPKLPAETLQELKESRITNAMFVDKAANAIAQSQEVADAFTLDFIMFARAAGLGEFAEEVLKTTLETSKENFVAHPILDANIAVQSAAKFGGSQAQMLSAYSNARKKPSREPISELVIINAQRLEALKTHAESRRPRMPEKLSEMESLMRYIVNPEFRKKMSFEAIKGEPTMHSKVETGYEYATRIASGVSSFLCMTRTWSIVAKTVFGMYDLIGPEFSTLTNLNAKTLRHRIFMLAYTAHCSDVLQARHGATSSRWSTGVREVISSMSSAKARACGAAMIQFLNAAYYEQNTNANAGALERFGRLALSKIVTYAGPVVVSGYFAYLTHAAATAVAGTFGAATSTAFSNGALIISAASYLGMFKYTEKFSVRQGISLVLALGSAFWFGWGLLGLNAIAGAIDSSNFFSQASAFAIRTNARLLASRTARKFSAFVLDRTTNIFGVCMSPRYVDPEKLYRRMLESTASNDPLARKKWDEAEKQEIMTYGLRSYKMNAFYILIKNMTGSWAASVADHHADQFLDYAVEKAAHRLVTGTNDDASNGSKAKSPEQLTAKLSNAVRSNLISKATQEAILTLKNAQFTNNGDYRQFFEAMLAGSRQIDESLQLSGITAFLPTFASFETAFLNSTMINFYSNAITSFATNILYRFIGDGSAAPPDKMNFMNLAEEDIKRRRAVADDRARQIEELLKRQKYSSKAVENLTEQRQKLIADADQREAALARIKKDANIKNAIKQLAKCVAIISVPTIGEIASAAAIAAATADTSQLVLSTFWNMTRHNAFPLIVFLSGGLLTPYVIKWIETYTEELTASKSWSRYIIRPFMSVVITMLGSGLAALIANPLVTSEYTSYNNALSMRQRIPSNPIGLSPELITAFTDASKINDAAWTNIDKLSSSTTAASMQALRVLVASESPFALLNCVGLFVSFIRKLADHLFVDNADRSLQINTANALNTLSAMEIQRRSQIIMRATFPSPRAVDFRASASASIDRRALDDLLRKTPDLMNAETLIGRIQSTLSCDTPFPKNIRKVVTLRQELLEKCFMSSGDNTDNNNLLTTFSRILFVTLFTHSAKADAKCVSFGLKIANDAISGIAISNVSEADIAYIRNYYRNVLQRRLFVNLYAFAFEWTRLVKYYGDDVDKVVKTVTNLKDKKVN